MNYEAYLIKALDMANSGKADDAVAIYHQAIAIDPQRSEAYDELGILYRELGNLSQAIHCFEKVTRLKPHDALAFNNLGTIYYKAELWSEAIHFLRQATILKPTYADAWYNLGRVFLELGHTDQTVIAWLNCLTHKHDHNATLCALRRLPIDKIRIIATAIPTISITSITEEMPFTYSQQWYDKAYHIGRMGLDWKRFSALNAQCEQSGYRAMRDHVLDEIPIPQKRTEWLEVGCHHGLTAYWVAKRFPQVKLHMFDFSQESVLWCQRQFPFPDRAIIWQASVECIKLPNNDLSGFFDFVSCLDVTEHLPPLVYKAMIEELWRVLKPNGHLILMQGNAPNVEHIHVLPENELVTDFVNFGFGLIKNLPYRHYLLRKRIRNVLC